METLPPLTDIEWARAWKDGASDPSTTCGTIHLPRHLPTPDLSEADPGDVNDARPDAVSTRGPNDFMTPGDGLLEGATVITCPVLWDLMAYHEYMRFCCHHCALEVCGEDGS
jgi:hypothetical protein